MQVDRQYFSSNLSTSRLNQSEYTEFINYILLQRPTHEELVEILDNDIILGNIISYNLTDNGMDLVLAENPLSITF